jgi:hypothetical protein
MATMTEPGAAAPAKELVSLADTTDLHATATGLMEFRRSLENAGFLRPGAPLSTEAIIEQLAVFYGTTSASRGPT